MCYFVVMNFLFTLHLSQRTTNARKIAMERFASNFTSTKQIAESKDLCRHYAEHVDLLGGNEVSCIEKFQLFYLYLCLMTALLCL